MRRFIPWCLLLALAVSAPALAATSVTVGITLGNAPPPPRVAFRSEPRWTPMSTIGVAYYEGPCDYDYFRCGSYFYIYNGGFWYRSPQYRGPFIAIRESYVPRAFYGLHDRGYHWRHAWKNVPPEAYRRVERRHERREERGEHGQHGQRGKHGERGGHGHKDKG